MPRDLDSAGGVLRGAKMRGYPLTGPRLSGDAGVTVCDREADIWALFVKATSQGAALLVRARRSTRRSVIAETGGKQDLVGPPCRRAPASATGKTVEIAACGGKRAGPARFKAKLDLRAGWVKGIAPPSAPPAAPGAGNRSMCSP